MRKKNIMKELENVVFDMEKTYGELQFGKLKNEVRRRIGSTDNRIIEREYSLISRTQAGEDIRVIIVGGSPFVADIKTPIELINPRVKAIGHKIVGRGGMADSAYMDFELIADGIKVIEK
jgi:hypothetical protein